MSTALSTPVLVLNRNWVAIRVVPASKAFGYLVRGVAEAIDVHENAYTQYDFVSWQEISQMRSDFEADEHDWIQTVRERLVVPVIVRLLTCDRRRVGKVRLSRRNVYLRDKHTCQYCGKTPGSTELNLDHVTPRCQGGITSWLNLVCSCVACNTRKAGRTPTQAGMRLIRNPHQPAAHEIPIKIGRIRHDSWQHFLDDVYWNVELQD